MERTGLILLATALVVTAGAVHSEGAGDRVKYMECPDGTLCPDKTTCCLLYGHRYVCCPFQSGQCCSDNIHCCPQGYKCDTANGTCVHAFRQQHLFAAQALEPVTPAPRRSRHRNVQEIGDIRCPDGNYCLDGQTCCLQTIGSYGCCPYQHAECCSDLSSCCPEGYQCKISTHQCIHATTNHSLPMLAKVEPIVRNTGRVVLKENEVSEVGNVRCPDGNYCLDGQTCCLLASGRYGCCPYQHAQCCSDHSSCCPEGYRCKVSTHQCLHATTNHTLPMLRKVDPIVRDSEPASRTEVGDIRCDDGNYCLDGQTCCLQTIGSYGCCPYQNAECCSDLQSCCPEGYQCKISTHQCIHATTNHTLPMLGKVEPIVRNTERVVSKENEVSEVGNVRCPDGNYCLDGQTCCLLASGRYGCCPYQHAQCCSDHSSCCPEGYRCKVSTHQCLHATTNHTLPMLRKVDPIVRDSEPASRTEVGDIRCDDGNYCLDGQTCCLQTIGSYGCCPYQNAECCSDLKSCCPEGYQCKISTHQCIHATTNHTLPMLGKVEPIVRNTERVVSKENEVGDIRCPDGNYCQDGQTCCLLAIGSYGCCPYQHAECCSDLSSCCPEGYQCKVSTHQCLHATTNHSLPMLRKVDPIVRDSERAVEERDDVGSVRCPDGNYCQDGQTCCLLSSGRYGCCPYQHAECCSDHSSCCPEGYRCRISTHQCIHATTNHTLPMLRKVHPVIRNAERVVPEKNEVGNIRCPDGNYCQDGQTCCLLTSGRYGCCPYQHAQCCSDHSSCCPEGYRCKISTHQCIHATTNHTVPMLRKVKPIVRNAELMMPEEYVPPVGSIRCPDGNYCQDGQTCCLMISGSYGCCPYQHAECCSDHSSCCPEGYQCRVSTHQCIHATTNHTLPMLRKVKPIVRSLAELGNAGDVICPDKHKCLSGQTCCQLSSGKYGCCPLPDAVCCEDHKSCCPQGYVCHVETQTCQFGDHSIPMVRKVPAIQDASAVAVPAVDKSCPDNSTCPNSMTCCPSGQSFSCCPYSDADCCPDGEHCCPKGFKCDSERQACVHKRRLGDAPVIKKFPTTLRP